MHKKFPANSFLFREVSGMWIRIDKPTLQPVTLAEFLAAQHIEIPEFCQFCRIIEPERHIEYRAYGGTIRINIDPLPYEDNSLS